MLVRLGDGVARLHAQLALGDGEIPELLALGRLLEELATLGIVEGDAPRGLGDHRPHLTGGDDHLSGLISDGVRALGRRLLRHHHEGGRFDGEGGL